MTTHITLWELPEVTTVAKAICLTCRMDAERPGRSYHAERGNHQEAICLTHRMDAERLGVVTTRSVGTIRNPSSLRGAVHSVDHACTGWMLSVSFGITLTPRTTRSWMNASQSCR